MSSNIPVFFQGLGSNPMTKPGLRGESFKWALQRPRGRLKSRRRRGVSLRIKKPHWAIERIVAQCG